VFVTFLVTFCSFEPLNPSFYPSMRASG